jgi:hypothetical protein
MHESVIFDLILERWDRRWIAKDFSIVELNRRPSDGIKAF